MLFFFLIVCTVYGCAAFPQTDSSDNPLITESESVRSFSPIKIFREYISPIDGNRCPMYPSCSAYSMEAIQKYGLIKGWVMTCDRLLRCGRDEVKLAPRVIIGGEAYCHDPVADNDFRPEKKISGY
ncbi:MAG: membrane protein insertion efficiency factor YidD [Desulfococcaceae bacterium]